VNPVAEFRALHEAGCFVMPNPWDAGSAKALAQLGFKALATTSAGFAFSRGKRDAPGVMSREATLAHIRDIVTATPLPVNADFQSGFGADPEGVHESVAMCVRTGVAGLSIEDATGETGKPLFDPDAAVDRLRAARRAIDASGIPVFLTARCEAWLVNDPEPLRTALDRLTAFAGAGADCLFAPGVRDRDSIASIVKAVAPKAVNVLVSAAIPGLTVASLAEVGVRRISVGSALARVAWNGFLASARQIAATGAFDSLSAAAPFAELNALFGGSSS
jgi:2-methylisocitrate lyase-like PEP mutase family enzyme